MSLLSLEENQGTHLGHLGWAASFLFCTFLKPKFLEYKISKLLHSHVGGTQV